ncbi:MAG: CRTAC1 family protein, partial [Planctomycetota bacterium]|nr:CRTAC1 family protein [Planctomycetota bacterium]
ATAATLFDPESPDLGDLRLRCVNHPDLLAAVAAAFGDAGPDDKEPYFRNAASDAGIAGKPAHRVAFVDINGDGWLDAVLDKQWVFINVPGKGGARLFEDFTGKSGMNIKSPDGKKDRIADIVLFADFDNDGDKDLYSGKYCDFQKPKKHPDKNEPLRDDKGNVVMEVPDDGLRGEIFLNDGSGRFTVKENSSVGSDPSTVCAVTCLDVDNDGLLDLFTGSFYMAYGWSLECYPARLYKGAGTGCFRDITYQSRIHMQPEPGLRTSNRPVYGAAHCDWNNDGLQDILVCAYGRQWNTLWKNNGDGTFTEVGDATSFDGDENEDGTYPPEVGRPKEDPFRSNGNTFDCPPADFDNDGDMDVFLAEITHSWAGPSSDLSCLLVNQGKEKDFAFLRDSKRGITRKHGDTVNWNQGDLHAGWIDFDNDGLLDLLIASSDYPDGQYLKLYRQKEDHNFEEVTDKAGFNWECPASISVGDYDRDGAVDILVGKSFMRLPAERTKDRIAEPGLFRNVVGTRNNWLAVTLTGNGKGGANRDAIGARVWVTTGKLRQMREVLSSLGHCGHRDSLVLHFGLGKAEKVDLIEVQWPNASRTKQTFKDVKINRYVNIVEGAKDVKYEDVK